MAQYYDQLEVGGGALSRTIENWFKAALRKAPDDLPTRQLVAVWALQKGKLALAKEQADAALRIETEDAKLPVEERKCAGSSVGPMLRGLVALWEKDWPAAEKYFQKVILDNPHDFVARNNLALALVEQKDPAKRQRALGYAETNVREQENNFDALSTLGWVHFRRGEFDQANVVLDKALKARNGNLDDDTAAYVAHLLYQQDEKWQAKEVLDKLLKADRPFSMRPEAQQLYEKVKDAKQPEAAPSTRTD